MPSEEPEKGDKGKPFPTIPIAPRGATSHQSPLTPLL
jgi:hypothetical protein